jgi:hypothetical protein
MLEIPQILYGVQPCGAQNRKSITIPCRSLKFHVESELFHMEFCGIHWNLTKFHYNFIIIEYDIFIGTKIYK